MDNSTSGIPLNEFALWKKMSKKQKIGTFTLELTARCNNDCGHCYINYPAGDSKVKAKELSFDEIDRITDELASLGALWCLITGGEPLLRPDFADIYMALKKKGFLISVFTNANLIRQEHIDLFKKYPPRDIEVSVYGVTKESYEGISRKPGSFATFERGLNMLLENNIKVRLKAMALRSNLHEMQNIADYCWEKTKDYFRFDYNLHLRFDRDPKRNDEIRAERISAKEAIMLEKMDSARLDSTKENYDRSDDKKFDSAPNNYIFRCAIGNGKVVIGHDGFLRPCASLVHPDCIYDLRKGTVTDAWENFIPKIREMRSDREEFLEKCRICQWVGLCMWCPAHAYLEVGELDAQVDYFCKIAHARAAMFDPE